MVNSFCRDLHSRINLTTSCFLASFESVSSDVEYCPVLVFFGFDSRISLSNKTSPSCFGDAMLNSTPHTLNISISSILISEIKEIFENEIKILG